MKLAPFFIALGLLVCIGCATPPEVKQALVAKDQSYAENERLMQQYRELVSHVTTRHQFMVSLRPDSFETEFGAAMGHYQSQADRRS